MKDKLEVGMFVRTKDGKIFDCYVSEQMGKPIYYPKRSKTNGYIDWNEVYKKSENIIDILEEGDYVNGKIVISIYEQDNKYYQYGKEFITHDKMIMYGDMASVCKLENLQIKSIVTKEMFESLEYKVD